MEFQDAKRELLEFAKVANACGDEYKKAYKSETPAELLAVVKSNANWCLNNSVISVDLLEKWFDASVLNENCIYTSGNHKLEAKEDISILTLGNSQATIKTLSNSQATIETLGNSQATIKTLGNSQATIKTLGNSQATIETLGNSQATIKTLSNSQATIETLGNSQATIKTLGNSQATYTVSGGLLQDRDKRKIYIQKSDYVIS